MKNYIKEGIILLSWCVIMGLILHNTAIKNQYNKEKELYHKKESLLIENKDLLLDILQESTNRYNHMIRMIYKDSLKYDNVNDTIQSNMYNNIILKFDTFEYNENILIELYK